MVELLAVLTKRIRRRARIRRDIRKAKHLLSLMAANGSLQAGRR